jgi:endonuclease/exonuclease/phosphatase family metal-dependent hydrolase
VTEAAPAIRVLTLNLWGVRGDWSSRREVLRTGLRAPRPDLLALQETIVTDSYDQVRDLLGAEYHVVHQRDREPDGQGVSLASRWPMRHVEELDLNVSERTADFACTTLLAEIDSPIGPLLLVNLAIRDCQRIFDQPQGGVWASDHFGLVADLAPRSLATPPR